MIHEVDDALRRMLRAEAVTDSDIEIALDAPTKDWAARRNVPTINMYLYDIREDLRRRQRGLLNEYGEDGRVNAEDAEFCANPRGGAGSPVGCAGGDVAGRAARAGGG